MLWTSKEIVWTCYKCSGFNVIGWRLNSTLPGTVRPIKPRLKKLSPLLIDQFWYVKIQPETMEVSTNLCWIPSVISSFLTKIRGWGAVIWATPLDPPLVLCLNVFSADQKDGWNIDGKTAENVWFLLFKNFLALYIEYIVILVSPLDYEKFFLLWQAPIDIYQRVITSNKNLGVLLVYLVSQSWEAL